jgi:hypothetical protein
MTNPPLVTHYPKSVIGKSEPVDEVREMPPIDNQLGCPHYPISVIGKSEPLDEVREMPPIDNQLGCPHYPISVIGSVRRENESIC